MSKQNDTNQAKGRSWDQITDGTTSAATMGAGATGDVGASAERKDNKQGGAEGARQQGSQGSAGRTDDLLSGGSSAEQSDHGFAGQGGQQGGQAAAGANRQAEKNER